MNLIIETDLGGDPDDFFALCYLISSGVTIRLINLSPGSKRQVAIARFIMKRLGLNIPIGVPNPNLEDKQRNDMHYNLLSKNNAPLIDTADGNGSKLLQVTLNNYPDAQLFLIGPLMNLGEYLNNNDLHQNRAVMQGGFVSFNIHHVPCRRIPKFEGHTYYRTFNLDQCIEGGKRFLQSNAKRYFIGKNICHLINYDKEIHAFLEKEKLNEPMKLFHEAAEVYFEKKAGKKFHDPLAAVALLHPEIFTWIRGTLMHTEKGWGTLLNEDGDHMAVDVDIDMFWEYLINGY